MKLQTIKLIGIMLILCVFLGIMSAAARPQSDCVPVEPTSEPTAAPTEPLTEPPTEPEDDKWAERAAEYPVATQVWLYMKNEFGWSDIICAGVIGNLMAECGGCWTSDLNWRSNHSGGLGMVQWIGGRRKQIIQYYGEQPTVEEQLTFMYNELYGLNGVTKQVTNKQLDAIMNAKTPEECAFAFASYYERCAEKHRPPRRGYARTAYEYFVD